MQGLISPTEFNGSGVMLYTVRVIGFVQWMFVVTDLGRDSITSPFASGTKTTIERSRLSLSRTWIKLRLNLEFRSFSISLRIIPSTQL